MASAQNLLDTLIDKVESNTAPFSLDNQSKAIAEAKALLSQHNQSHVLDHVDDIKSAADLNRLLTQIRSIDFVYISKLYQRAMAEEKALKETEDEKNEGPQLTPFPHKDAFDISSIGDVDKLVTLGFKAIVEGQCAVIILAGGQGTRLGFNRPKGCFNVGFPSQKSIYQLQIEKVMAVKRAAARALKVAEVHSIKIPIYFMTSTATHDATQQFLDSNDCFGYNAQEIKLFMQQQHPCLREGDGALIMKSPSEIAMSPNGNGGIYSSLKVSGVLKEMQNLGVQYVQVFLVFVSFCYGCLPVCLDSPE